MNKKIIAIITARGGSKRIPRKNLKICNGKPLIFYTVQEALKSKFLDQVCLTTDSKDIIDYCQSIGLSEKYVRPLHLSADDTPSLPVIQDYVSWKIKTDNYKPDYILLLQPTSPLRTVKDIDNAIELMLKSSADSLVSVVDAPHTLTPESIMRLEGEFLISNRSQSQIYNQLSNPKYYSRNGAIYLFSYDCLMNKNSLYGEKILPFIMLKENSVDIDDDFDFEICEYLLKKRDKS